ncbi:MBL fold metallo-hydrolase [Ruegeria arenilitoris]|uniref:Hydroxyacylglutathione hydrolase n=1 Tax=Ruegeria arenilitoris TaxID=1173585 RepID=A0A238JVZ4_9RHOB|nr:MBL fold metallo-hydrolase [Ruegeria arenilitoris]SMX34839.1 Hydroxyacylglutathione hydrolase [Ruegeria arenilitoris]
MLPADDFNPKPGIPVALQPGLRLLLAPNPSPMTYLGTNTYLLGTSDLAVIDPGPLSDSHMQAILDALQPGQKISHIVVTHSHLDHSPLAAPLSERTGAPIYAFGGPQAGRSTVMSQLAEQGLAGGGEGIDMEFRPDIELADGDRLEEDGWGLEVIHTPGHLGNHIALAWGDVCFTADHVMGWASSLVSPPDGDLTDFMKACHRLRARDWSIFHAGHGAPITDPSGRLDWLIRHRLEREAQILDALAERSGTARDLAQRIYVETPPALLPAAERNVFAHLVDLTGKDRVAPQGALSVQSSFHRIA